MRNLDFHAKLVVRGEAQGFGAYIFAVSFIQPLMLSEQENLRREALGRMRELKIEPYPAERFPVSHTAAQIASDGELTEKAQSFVWPVG